MHCERISPHLVNQHIHCLTYLSFFVCVWEHLSSLLANFQYNTVSSIVIMFYIRSSDLVHLEVKVSTLLPTSPYSPLHPPSIFVLFVSMSMAFQNLNITFCAFYKEVRFSIQWYFTECFTFHFPWKKNFFIYNPFKEIYRYGNLS